MAGLEKLSGGSTIFMNAQDSVFYIEIVWTEPERLHDAKSEWRGRITIAGYFKENCGDVYIFAVGPYSYRKTRRVVGIAIEI